MNNASTKLTNNANVKSLVNTIKLKYNKPPPDTVNSNLVDSIAIKIKNKLSINLKYWLGFILPILIILFYLLYSYNLGSRSKYSIDNMNYKKQITHTPLLQCYQQEAKYQFKLCDYYISSSFMTPCVGNQHYDYVSNDMITEVIQSGARYIQIPICEADVGMNALPVVGTAFYGDPLVTSLNTLEIASVFKTILGNAFTLNNKTVNYPLIIHLILHTTKKFTLNVVAETIKQVFTNNNNNIIVDVSKYKTFPIFLDKLCNLLGKIIIISTPGYKGTNLESYIVPTNNLFNMYVYSELDQMNVPSDTLHKTAYNNKLSSHSQKKSANTFKTKYPSINHIVKNMNTIGTTILNDKEILNNLTSFNKVGITVVKPMNSTDIISINYDQTEAIYLGCQWITMNFQVNDINMKNYLEVFKDSSFRLKPSSMRFSETEEPIVDLLSIYSKFIQKNNNILNDFYYKYNNTLISIESYTLMNTFITQVENNLKFNTGTTKFTDSDGTLKFKLDVNQCFIPHKSTIGGTGDISIYLESAALPGKYITLIGETFNLQDLSLNKKGLINQAFFIEKPKTTDGEQVGDKGEMISIRTFNNTDPLYLAFDNKLTKAYHDMPQVQAHNNMTFFVKEIKYKIIVKLITLYDGSLKSMGGNIIGVLESNNTDGTSYIVIPTNKISGNFNIFKNQFMLQNKDTEAYVISDDATGFIYDRDIMPTSNGIFNLEASNGYFKILNIKNQNLILYNRNLIKFVESNTIKSNENLFKIDIQYELI